MLIDTHFIVWYFTNNPCLQKHEWVLIEQAIYKGNAYISTMSFLEIVTLERKRRLQILMPLKDWFAKFIHLPGITTLPLSLEVALESGKLPGTFHPDPADRILVATARVYNIPLLTRDSQILAYGSAGHVGIAGTHA